MKTTLRNSGAGKKAGFSLIELVITMTIMALLVGVVSMRASGQTDKAKATKIMKIADELKTACALYAADTGQVPREYCNYQGETYHRLSMDPGVTGWSGPYMEKPISRSMHPGNNNDVHLRPGAWAPRNGGNGFDLDGNGTSDIAQNVWWNTCCTLDFDDGITEEIAVIVDEAFDKNLPGTWSDSGVVEFHGTSLSILLYHQ